MCLGFRIPLRSDSGAGSGLRVVPLLMNILWPVNSSKPNMLLFGVPGESLLALVLRSRTFLGFRICESWPAWSFDLGFLIPWQFRVVRRHMALNP